MTKEFNLSNELWNRYDKDEIVEYGIYFDDSCWEARE